MRSHIVILGSGCASLRVSVVVLYTKIEIFDGKKIQRIQVRSIFLENLAALRLTFNNYCTAVKDRKASQHTLQMSTKRMGCNST